MAKMFYTMDETKAALGRSEEEVKQLSREGKLREFRDGARLMFKADQVEAVKAELGGMGNPADTDVGISLAGSASGMPLSLADSDPAASPGGGMGIKDDTALAADIGLSGSMGGMPSPRSGTGSGRSGSGINVFNPDEIEAADPAAQTAISPAGGFEGAGSGSGLLDLTREADDTSLGAVLDDVGGTGTGRAAMAETSPAGTTAMGGVAAPAVVRSAPPTIVEDDPMAPAFGGLAAGAAVFGLIGLYALISAVAGAQPLDLLKSLADLGVAIFAAIGLGIAAVFLVLGIVLGKALR